MLKINQKKYKYKEKYKQRKNIYAHIMRYNETYVINQKNENY